MIQLSVKNDYTLQHSHIQKLLEPYSPKIIIELGANDGGDTREFLKYIGDDGLIIAVEANPNLDINIKDNRCRFICAAIQDDDAWKGNFNICNAHGSSSLHHAINMPHVTFETIETPYITLEGIFRYHNLKMVDFIWCDIEGADIVNDGSGVWEDKIRYFYTEVHNEPIYENQILYHDVVKNLEFRGFELVHRFKHDVLFRSRRLTEEIEII